MIVARWLLGMTVVASIVVAMTGELALAERSADSLDPPDVLPGVLDPPASSTDPIAPDSARTGAPASGNPLWAISLGSLSATRERPIFLPSRRPPAPAVAAAPYVEPAKATSAPVEPERPLLSLVGIVTGTADGFAVFIDVTTHDIVRLKTGEGYEGWILRSVREREAVLEKNHRTAVIGLPTPIGDPK